MHIGQPVVAAPEAIRQSTMVDAGEVQNSGVEVVDVNWIFEDIEGVVVGSADALAGFDASPGQPGREAASVMVASVVVHQLAFLGVDGASEFSGADDKSVFEQSALLEVGQECGGRLIKLPRLARLCFFALRWWSQSRSITWTYRTPASGHQAIGRVAPGDLRLWSIQVEVDRRGAHRRSESHPPGSFGLPLMSAAARSGRT